MPSPLYYVYCWKDADRRLAHVFWGDASEPDRRWNKRNDTDSQLNDWLRTLASQPALDGLSFVSSPMYGNWARTLVRALFRQLKDDGYTLLNSRDRSTVRAGNQEPRWIRAMYQGRFCYFRSVRSAARALGITSSAVTRAASNPKRQDIRYVGKE